MKHFVRRMQAFAASLVIVAAGVQAQKAPRDMDRFIDQLMKKMTLEEKIGSAQPAGKANQQYPQAIGRGSHYPFHQPLS